MKVGVLVSGAGTNLQALLDASSQPDFPARVVLVACRFADGKNAQLAPAGSPVQLNATAAVKVPVVPKVKLVALLGFPGTAVTEPGDGAPKMKSPTLTVTCDA